METEDQNRNAEWDDALKILNADGVTWSYVSASNPLPVLLVAASGSPSSTFNAWDISSTNPLPATP